MKTEKRLILFKDGASGMYLVYAYQGPAMVGDPCAYVYRDGKFTWVSPGESVDFVER